ncbi:MAG: M20 family metallopeptidase [Hungatella sp.]|nr:M20 family metallopeptidase [Hungatella sp.]
MYYTFLEAGKSREAHEAVVYGAKILAGTCMELLEKPELLEEIREEFRMAKKHSGAV